MSRFVAKSSPSRQRSSSGLIVYVVILMSMQVFLISVAAEAFMADDERLAWATAGVSVALLSGTLALVRFLRPQ